MICCIRKPRWRCSSIRIYDESSSVYYPGKIVDDSDTTDYGEQTTCHYFHGKYDKHDTGNRWNGDSHPRYSYWIAADVPETGYVLLYSAYDKMVGFQENVYKDYL